MHICTVLVMGLLGNICEKLFLFGPVVQKKEPFYGFILILALVTILLSVYSK